MIENSKCKLSCDICKKPLSIFIEDDFICLDCYAKKLKKRYNIAMPMIRNACVKFLLPNLLVLLIILVIEKMSIQIDSLCYFVLLGVSVWATVNGNILVRNIEIYFGDPQNIVAKGKVYICENGKLEINKITGKRELTGNQWLKIISNILNIVFGAIIEIGFGWLVFIMITIRYSIFYKKIDKLIYEKIKNYMLKNHLSFNYIKVDNMLSNDNSEIIDCEFIEKCKFLAQKRIVADNGLVHYYGVGCFAEYDFCLAMVLIRDKYNLTFPSLVFTSLLDDILHFAPNETKFMIEDYYIEDIKRFEGFMDYLNTIDCQIISEKFGKRFIEFYFANNISKS